MRFYRAGVPKKAIARNLKMSKNTVKSLIKKKKPPKIDHPEYRLLLESRYLDFMTWKEIAGIMCYSSRQVQRIHGKALADFDKRFLKNGSI